MRRSGRLEAIWRGERTANLPWRWALRGAAAVWSVGRAAHRLLYASGLRSPARLPCPVVSVGNLGVGGTGKTPIVAELARRLIARGQRVLVVARGYGRAAGALLNEEGEWLRAAVPGVRVVQDPRRAAAARRELAAAPADVVLLDDGFQHEALARDLELVLVDATSGFGNGLRLPAGPLRDAPAALRRADLVLLTRCELATAAEQERTRAAIRAAAPAAVLVAVRFDVATVRTGDERRPAQELAGQAVLLASGVGQPATVERTLVALGARLVGHVRFADHHAYRRDEVDALLRQAAAGGARLVTTAKDAVKWDALAPERRTGWSVVEQVVTVVEGEADLAARLDALLRRSAPAAGGD